MPMMLIACVALFVLRMHDASRGSTVVSTFATGRHWHLTKLSLRTQLLFILDMWTIGFGLWQISKLSQGVVAR